MSTLASAWKAAGLVYLQTNSDSFSHRVFTQADALHSSAFSSLRVRPAFLTGTGLQTSPVPAINRCLQPEKSVSTCAINRQRWIAGGGLALSHTPRFSTAHWPNTHYAPSHSVSLIKEQLANICFTLNVFDWWFPKKLRMFKITKNNGDMCDNVTTDCVSGLTVIHKPAFVWREQNWFLTPSSLTENWGLLYVLRSSPVHDTENDQIQYALICETIFPALLLHDTVTNQSLQTVWSH